MLLNNLGLDTSSLRRLRHLQARDGAGSRPRAADRLVHRNSASVNLNFEGDRRERTRRRRNENARWPRLGGTSSCDWTGMNGLPSIPPFQIRASRSAKSQRAFSRNATSGTFTARSTACEEIDSGHRLRVLPRRRGFGERLRPDARWPPGQARVLAAQGFTVLAITYPGPLSRLAEPGARPIPQRQPLYLLDRESADGRGARSQPQMHVQPILQGAGQLVSQELSGRDLLVWGHSTRVRWRLRCRRSRPMSA